MTEEGGKLSEAQRKVLDYCDRVTGMSHQWLRKAGLSRSIRSLEQRGLLEPRSTVGGIRYRTNEAGRSALSRTRTKG